MISDTRVLSCLYPASDRLGGNEQQCDRSVAISSRLVSSGGCGSFLLLHLFFVLFLQQAFHLASRRFRPYRHVRLNVCVGPTWQPCFSVPIAKRDVGFQVSDLMFSLLTPKQREAAY